MNYYISSSIGNDDNNGLSENSPFKTIDKINSILLRSNDRVYLKKGDVFYSVLRPNIIKVNNEKLKISSYGTGENPKIFYSKNIVKNVYELHSNNIYKINLKNTNNYEGIKNLGFEPSNVGYIYSVLKDKIYGNRKQNISELLQNMDFYCDDMYIYIYSDVDIYDSYGILNLACNHILLYTDKENIEISNIDFDLCGGHGLQLKGCKNIDVFNCEIGKIGLGGSILQGTSFTRYGNGVEVANGGYNINIYNNKFKNIYDTATTMQGYDSVWENVNIFNNTISRCSQSFELWTNTRLNSTTGGIKKCSFKNNICMYQGKGWSSDLRPDKESNSEFLMYDFILDDLDIIIEKNIIISPSKLYSIKETTIDKFKKGIVSKNNKLILSVKDKLISHTNGTNIIEVTQFTEFKNLYSKEINSTINYLDNDYFEDIIAMINSNSYMNDVNNYKNINDINENHWLIKNNNNVNKYIKLCDVNITEPGYGSICKLELNEIAKTSFANTVINFKVKQQNAMSQAPSIIGYVSNTDTSILLPTDFIMLTEENSETITKVGIYYKFTTNYCDIEINKLYERNTSKSYIVYYEDNILLESLPSGTQTQFIKI